MSKREKIIVIVLLIAVVYGGYEYFSGFSINKHSFEDKNACVNLTKFVADIGEKIKQNESDKKNFTVLTKASLDWTLDPFWKSVLKKENNEKKQAERALPKKIFVYSGYLQLGNKKIAIINNMEYEVGEKVLNHEGYSVLSISSKKVVLAAGKNGKKLILSIKDEN